MNTELQILRSDSLARRVVSAIGVNKLYPEISSEARPSDPRVMGAAVRAFSASFVADRVPDSDVIRLTFRHGDPELSALALNRIVDQFKEKHLEAFSEPAATAFLQEKVDNYRQALGQSDEQLRSMQVQGKSYSVDEQRSALSQQRREVEAAIKDAGNQVAGLNEKLLYLKSQQQNAAGSAVRGSSDQNKAIADANAQLLELQLQEQKLLGTFSENSRTVQSVRKQIELVKQFLDAQRGGIGQGEFAEQLERQSVNVLAELRYQEARRNSLYGQLAQVDKQFRELTAHEGGYRELVNDREANEKNYRTYAQKLEEARISEDMDREKIASISVIEEAVAPLRPIWPSWTINLLLGVLCGLTLGYAWAFAAERFGWEDAWRPARASAHSA